MALWAGSYLRAASGPETGHVDIGGTHIPASVSTVSLLPHVTWQRSVKVGF